MSRGIEENTLGVVVGREHKHRRNNRDFRRSARTVSTTRANQGGLGTRDLGFGMAVCGGIIVVFLLWRFIYQWPAYEQPILSIASWCAMILTITLVLLGVGLSSGGMPSWLFASTLAGAAVAVGLDIAACWGPDQHVYPTAAVAVGSLLLPIVTLRETRQVIAATAVLGGVLTAAALLEVRADPLTLAPDFVVITLAVVPPMLGVAIVRAFRRMVQLELDLVLVQSTVDAPRLAVGMLASEELARLDLDAEQLLNEVAEGRAALPLARGSSSKASSLATQLRLHLIEGRKETWLRNAVMESEFLAPSVTIDDPASLAGLLDPEQRDALLIVIWLLVSDSERRDATVHIEIGPRHPFTAEYPRTLRFPIVLAIRGVPRRRVDLAAWEAMGVVGPHLDSTHNGDLRVEIDCSVDNPADA
ncbi:hypothetical protein [Luethyella okanaganae]|uniref:Uncharacterized protein n=1 Tax=Luethyella okanaganae TaxID=69372 RepID=A0ABW1VAB0_9MICO